MIPAHVSGRRHAVPASIDVLARGTLRYETCCIKVLIRVSRCASTHPCASISSKRISGVILVPGAQLYSGQERKGKEAERGEW
jgi:hypothetical protein